MSNSLAQAAVTIGGLFESAYYHETEQSSEENTEQSSDVLPTKDPNTSPSLVVQGAHAPMKDLQFGIEDFKALFSESSEESVNEQ